MKAGDKIAQYELYEELGRGGMGTVFRARDLDNGRLVALKVLPPELALNASLLQRFRREVQTMKTLEHPHIVRIFDVGESNHTYYFAMEYMGGGSLEKLLQKQSRLPVLQALDIVIQVAEALDYSHQKNLIHRDIKPANVLMNEEGVIKLSDFGIAKVIEATRMTVTGGIMGTVDYMAPEQAEGRAITAKTDIYALGAMLYQMLTSQVPFIGETPTQVIQKHRFSLPEPPRNLNPEVPESLSMLVETMLQKDPSRRIPTAAALMHVLEKIKDQAASGAPAPATPPTPVVTATEQEPETVEKPWTFTPPPTPYPRHAQRSSRWPLVVGIGILAGLLVLWMGYGQIREIFERKISATEMFDEAREAYFDRGDVDQAGKLCLKLIRLYSDSEEAEMANHLLREMKSAKRWDWEPALRFVLVKNRWEEWGRYDSDWRELIKDDLNVITNHFPEHPAAQKARNLLDEISKWETRRE